MGEARWRGTAEAGMGSSCPREEKWECRVEAGWPGIPPDSRNISVALGLKPPVVLSFSGSALNRSKITKFYVFKGITYMYYELFSLVKESASHVLSFPLLTDIFDD